MIHFQTEINCVPESPGLPGNAQRISLGFIRPTLDGHTICGSGWNFETTSKSLESKVWTSLEQIDL